MTPASQSQTARPQTAPRLADALFIAVPAAMTLFMAFALTLG